MAVSGQQAARLADEGALTSATAYQQFNTAQPPASSRIALEADMRFGADFATGLGPTNRAFADIFLGVNTTEGPRDVGFYAIFAGPSSPNVTGYILEHSSGSNFIQSSVAATLPFTYQTYRIEIDNAAGTLTGFVNNAPLVSINVSPGWVTSVTRAGMHMLRQQGASNSSSVLFDNFRLYEPVYSLSGTIQLQDTVLPMAGHAVNIEIRNGATVVESFNNVILGAGGTFQVQTSAVGTHTVRVRGSHWVSRSSAPVTIGPGGVSGLTYALPNGDSDVSGEVDAADIDMIIANFGMTSGNPGFVANADLDESGEVDATDIDVAIANFGAVDE